MYDVKIIHDQISIKGEKVGEQQNHVGAKWEPWSYRAVFQFQIRLSKFKSNGRSKAKHISTLGSTQDEYSKITLFCGD